jgi:hypothetical protein
MTSSWSRVLTWRSEDFWNGVLDGLKRPFQTERIRTETTGGGGSVSGGTELNLGVAKGRLDNTAKLDFSHADGHRAVFPRRGLEQVAEEAKARQLVIFVDDFHYIPRELQPHVARQIKAGAEAKIRFCTASVPHRSDDVVRSNPELRGRVTPIDFPAWNVEQLRSIGAKGGGKLNMEFQHEYLTHAASQSLGSPQLMQAIMLQTCIYKNYMTGFPTPQKVALGVAEYRSVTEPVAAKADFRKLVEKLVRGATKRGTKRKLFRLKHGGGQADVYVCIINALIKHPVKLSLSADTIVNRIGELCHGEHPTRQAVIETLSRLSQIAKQVAKSELILEYDFESERVDIVDPYFMFYLVHCDRKIIRWD